jgi:hypothetical protein
MARGQRSWWRARTGNAMRLEASALLTVDAAPRWSQSAPERSALSSPIHEFDRTVPSVAVH